MEDSGDTLLGSLIYRSRDEAYSVLVILNCIEALLRVSAAGSMPKGRRDGRLRDQLRCKLRLLPHFNVDPDCCYPVSCIFAGSIVKAPILGVRHLRSLKSE